MAVTNYIFRHLFSQFGNHKSNKDKSVSQVSQVTHFISPDLISNYCCESARYVFQGAPSSSSQAVWKSYNVDGKILVSDLNYTETTQRRGFKFLCCVLWVISYHISVCVLNFCFMMMHLSTEQWEKFSFRESGRQGHPTPRHWHRHTATSYLAASAHRLRGLQENHWREW